MTAKPRKSSSRALLKKVSLSKKPKRSSLEQKFALLWPSLTKFKLEEEYKFHATRKWRSDFAHISSRVLIEIEGGVWSGGRHTRGLGYAKDCEKYNNAAYDDWAVIRFTSRDITIENIQQLIALIEKRLISR